jgi:putative membrane protein
MAVICWLAALFYLPRLFVYHAMAEDSISIERFKLMQRKLYRGIANPSMIATVILGLWLVAMAPEAYVGQGWFHLKAVFVILLIGYHHMCLAHMKKLANDSSEKSHVYFRFFNEVPVIFMVAIVILVIVKPF